MKPSLVLALLLLSAPAARADDVTPQGEPGAQTQAERPDPRLALLEQELLRKLQEPGLDRKSPEYRQFASAFRARLDGVMEEVPPNALNKGYHARILARLDESGSRQAVADLNAGLESNPADHELRVSLGHVQALNGDYPSAAATARAVLDFQGEPRPTPQQIEQARSLWYSTKDRIAGASTSETRPLAGTIVQTGPAVVAADDRPAVLAIKAGSALPGAVPATVTSGSDAENPPASSPYWPWPAGWALTLIGGAAALKRKLDDENLTGPVAMTGMGLSLLAFSAMFPPASVVTTPEGVKLILAPAVAKAAVGTVGSALTAKGAVEVGQALVSNATGDGTSSQGNPEPKGGEPSKPTVEQRLDKVGLPREGNFRFEPPKNYKPGNELPSVRDGKVKGYVDRHGNVWYKGNYHGKPGQFDFEWDVQLSEAGKRLWGQFARGKSYINVRPDGLLSH